MTRDDMPGQTNMRVCNHTPRHPEGMSCNVVQLRRSPRKRPSAAAHHTCPLWERSLKARDLDASRDGDDKVVGQDVRAQGFENAIQVLRFDLQQGT